MSFEFFLSWTPAWCSHSLWEARGPRAPWREPIWMTCSTSLGRFVVVVVVPICCWWPDSVECDVLFSGLRFH